MKQVIHDRWFLRIGWFHLPLTFMGWLISIFAITISIIMYVVVSYKSTSTMDSVISVFPYVICIFAVRHWIASNTCN
ncbi:MAG: hypothetical protein IPH89_07990 [Bacteroidetes bacterium]|nr:hypothetical protein [Bacteroidota bacterium]